MARRTVLSEPHVSFLTFLQSRHFSKLVARGAVEFEVLAMKLIVEHLMLEGVEVIEAGERETSG